MMLSLHSLPPRPQNVVQCVDLIFQFINPLILSLQTATEIDDVMFQPLSSLLFFFPFSSIFAHFVLFNVLLIDFEAVLDKLCRGSHCDIILTIDTVDTITTYRNQGSAAASTDICRCNVHALARACPSIHIAI